MKALPGPCAHAAGQDGEATAPRALHTEVTRQAAVGLPSVGDVPFGVHVGFVSLCSERLPNRFS